MMNPNTASANPTLIQQIQHLHDKVLVLQPRLEAILSTIQRMLGMPALILGSGKRPVEEGTRALDQLQLYSSYVEGYLRGAGFLEKRICSVLKLVSSPRLRFYFFYFLVILRLASSLLIVFCR